ncbi:hypothetical protein LX36DRAFT_123282 [Colletotrichum falcatum]|nr:hypothetical protein LX36DRAFT_123282 [Colletotrichum falcatum]
MVPPARCSFGRQRGIDCLPTSRCPFALTTQCPRFSSPGMVKTTGRVGSHRHQGKSVGGLSLYSELVDLGKPVPSPSLPPSPPSRLTAPHLYVSAYGNGRTDKQRTNRPDGMDVCELRGGLAAAPSPPHERGRRGRRCYFWFSYRGLGEGGRREYPLRYRATIAMD